MSIMDRLRRARSELWSISNAIPEIRRDLATLLERSTVKDAPAVDGQPTIATWVPPGHFYSPIADVEQLRARRDIVFDRERPVEEIAFRDAEQLALLSRLSAHVSKLPFSADKAAGLRYHFDNPHFSFGDGTILASMLMETRPKRMIEIGSGYSSALTLDINDAFLAGELNVTFVEPYPHLLYSLMSPEDRAKHKVIVSKVQDVELELFDQLEAGDILFIDSTHVTKADSDVNFEIFHVLPRLKSGVLIHIHDIFYPFEYPEEWLLHENRSWNELYLVRAFLMYNDKFDIEFFNSYMYHRHRDAFISAMPNVKRNWGGSLWLRKR